MSPAIASPSQITAFDLHELNQRFESAHPREILAWCLENLPTGLVQSTAFGITGMAIVDMLYRVLKPTPRVPVLFLDTLHHFPQTLAFIERVKEAYHTKLAKIVLYY